MSSVEIEIEDDTYEVEITSFERPIKGNRRGHPDRWTPDEGGELELGEIVKVWGLGFVEDGPGSGNAEPMVLERITLDEFIRRFAEYHAIDSKAARRKLEDQCMEEMLQRMEDDYDDRDQ